LSQDRLAAGAAAIRIIKMKVAEEFGGQHGTMPFRGIVNKVITDDLFGMTIRIQVGRVDEVAAAVEKARKDRVCLGRT